jgi:hypothetical protein
MPDPLFPGCVDVEFSEARDLCSMMGRSDKREYSSAQRARGNPKGVS